MPPPPSQHIHTHAHTSHGSSALAGKAFKTTGGGFPDGSVLKNLPASAGDMSSTPGLGRSHMPSGNWACVHHY